MHASMSQVHVGRYRSIDVLNSDFVRFRHQVGILATVDLVGLRVNDGSVSRSKDRRVLRHADVHCVGGLNVSVRCDRTARRLTDRIGVTLFVWQPINRVRTLAGIEVAQHPGALETKARAVRRHCGADSSQKQRPAAGRNHRKYREGPIGGDILVVDQRDSDGDWCRTTVPRNDAMAVSGLFGFE